VAARGTRHEHQHTDPRSRAVPVPRRVQLPCGGAARVSQAYHSAGAPLRGNWSSGGHARPPLGRGTTRVVSHKFVAYEGPMNRGVWRGENRSDTRGIARIFNAARRQKARDFCYRLVGHHTRIDDAHAAILHDAARGVPVSAALNGSNACSAWPIATQ
jgi:hypothetical protein